LETKHIPMKQTIALLILIGGLANTASAQLTGPLESTGAQSNFAQYLRLSSVDGDTNKGDAPTTEFNNRERTKGKRFLFNSWVKGSGVTDVHNQTLDVSNYLFNFDMQTGNLLVTENKKNIMSVAPSGVKTFTLETGGRSYPFLHVPIIDSSRFFLQLAGGDSLFTLYKECKVKFVQSNYHNDGMIQTGNPDDEYVDISAFYLTRPGESTFRQMSFKPKEIKNLLVSKKEKVSGYFSDHSNDEIDEAFLIGLINTVNRK
jgi:hypothetical protein